MSVASLLATAAEAGRRRPTPPAPALARGEGPECDPAISRPGKASNEEIAGRIGVNVKIRRAESGLTLRQLAEATETHFTHLSRIERGVSKIPQLALILKLAGSLNVRCGLITAGVIWDPTSGAFRIEECAPAPHTAVDQLGANAKRARLLADLSQQALADRASMSRGDLVDFERGNRNFGIFIVIRLAGALGLPFPPGCLPAWRIGTSARLLYRNSCPEKRRPKPSATSFSSGSGEKDEGNRRSLKHWIWQEARLVRTSAICATLGRIFRIAAHRETDPSS